MVSDCGGTYWPLGVEPNHAEKIADCVSCGLPTYPTWVFCEECWVRELLSSTEYSAYEKARNNPKSMSVYDAIETGIGHEEYVRRLRKHKCY